VGPLAPLLILVAVVASDIWVYLDASRLNEDGDPVVLRLWTFRIQSPQAWFIFCLALWIIAFPLYLTGRRQRV
jgi:hypothetical protein